MQSRWCYPDRATPVKSSEWGPNASRGVTGEYLLASGVTSRAVEDEEMQQCEEKEKKRKKERKGWMETWERVWIRIWIKARSREGTAWIEYY